MREDEKSCENSYYVFCIKIFAYGGGILNAQREYLTFLCHECSDINSVSGEACVIRARESDKCAVFKLNCLKDYKLPTTERDRKLAGFLILPDELRFAPDFYLVASDEAARNYRKVITAPLWDVNCMTYDISEEKREAEKQYLEQRIERAKVLKEFRLQEAVEEAQAVTTISIPCTLETDPLRAGWQA